MKLKLTSAVLVLAMLLAPLAYGQGFQDPDTKKAAQTNFKFLSISVDPQSAALANAVTAEPVGSSLALFNNPATMASMQTTMHAAVMQTQFIADINYNAGTIAFSPSGGVYGVIGVSVVAVDYGEFLGTIHAENERGYEDTGNFSPSALAIGLGYARNLSDRFAVGGNVKLAHQNLTSAFVDRQDNGDLISQDYNKSTMVFDFGVLYRTGFRSLNFAMAVRNFSQELQYEQESFELPLTFRIGVSMDIMDLTNMNKDMQSFRVSIDAERPRDYAEQLRIGGEYLIMNTLALRAGYAFPTDTENFSLGAGLQMKVSGVGLSVNYAYTSYDTFDPVHRFGIQLGL